MLRPALAAAILAFASAAGNAADLPTSPRAEAVIAAESPLLQIALEPMGATLGGPVYLRVFKEERVLEAWVAAGGTYKLFKTYPICAMSGQLGPKLAVGDNQAPEGFYDVRADQLNPVSSFYLALNIGYPNVYDRELGHTGSNIMIHGNCVSIGCFAMTNGRIEEIYTLARAALAGGQASVPVHVFPFRPTAENLTRHAQERWAPFWNELRPAYDAFEASHIPPMVVMAGGHYAIAN